MTYESMAEFERGYIVAALDQFGTTREWLDWTNTHSPRLSDLSPHTRFAMRRDAAAFLNATRLYLGSRFMDAGEAFWYSRNDLEGPSFSGPVWDGARNTLLVAAQAAGPFRLVIDRANDEIIRAREDD